MGESDRQYPLEFQPQCPQFAWMLEHLDGWQFGEQGLLLALTRVTNADGIAIEYGAGNGETLPLTIDQLYRGGMSCILAEIDSRSRKSLEQLYPQAFVDSTFKWKLSQEAGQAIAVVVIDIDGKDSIVMRQMFDAGCRPALLVCEHMDRCYSIGTTLPSPIPEWLLGTETKTGHVIQDTAETLQWIAAKYGYERIGLNRCNSFFVRKDLFSKLFRYSKLFR